MNIKQENIIHIISSEKFTKDFIQFLDNNFSTTQQMVLVIDHSNKYEIPQSDMVRIVNNKISLIPYLFRTKKVFLHGLSDIKILLILTLFPALLKKTYWIIWGGDLYTFLSDNKSLKWRIKEFFRNKTIPNLKGFVTYIKGDYELAQKWYGAKGKYYECFMYPSNLYKEYDIEKKTHQTINIQVGNSADSTNNHIEAFEKLEKYKGRDIKIIVPLSYGDKTYAKEVIEQGKKIFGDKFEPLTEFMPFDKYLNLLAEIDISIFNHNRQQAMGNIITLLGLGKKVYMRNDITPWRMFEDIGIDVFDVANVTIDLLDEDTKRHNQERIKEYFSEENYLRQLNKLFRS